MDNINLEYTDIFDNNKVKKLSFSKHLINKDFKKESLFALIVDGKSMEPMIKHRSVVVVDLSQKQLLDENIYIVYYKNKMWIKKYISSNNSFVSINPDFSHLVYEIKDIYVVGNVLFTFTNL